MDFRKVLAEALKICGKHADDPFLLYCTLCDQAGNDYALSQQVEVFHKFNKAYGLVAEMKKNPEPRTIGTLLERCREQPDVPKSCLKWIHTIFELYYRAKHGERKDTEQILESLEADLFEPELEGLDLPKPKPKQKKPGAKRTPKANTPNPAPAKVATPPTPAPQTPSPTPFFQPVNPPLPPGAVYRNLPYNANVYLAEGSRIIHVSSECPCIRPALNQTLYKATYHRARYKDFYNLNHLTKNTTTYERLSLNHTPPVCAKCGDFTPILFGKPPKIQYKQL